MRNDTHHTGTPRRAGRTFRRAGLAAALFLLPLATGCGDEMSRAWRAAAMPELETGLRAISNALISGFIELNTPDSNGESTTG